MPPPPKRPDQAAEASRAEAWRQFIGSLFSNPIQPQLGSPDWEKANPERAAEITQAAAKALRAYPRLIEKALPPGPTGDEIGPLPPSFGEGSLNRKAHALEGYRAADAIARGDLSYETVAKFAAEYGALNAIDDEARRLWLLDVTGGPPRIGGRRPYYVSDLLQLHPEYAAPLSRVDNALRYDTSDYRAYDQPGAFIRGLPWDRRDESIDLRLDVNTAGEALLSALPGVGPSLAGRIVDGRESGPYRSAADLDERVRGIGPATLADLVPYLRFPGEPARPRPTYGFPYGADRVWEDVLWSRRPRMIGPLGSQGQSADDLELLPVGPARPFPGRYEGPEPAEPQPLAPLLRDLSDYYGSALSAPVPREGREAPGDPVSWHDGLRVPRDVLEGSPVNRAPVTAPRPSGPGGLGAGTFGPARAVEGLPSVLAMFADRAAAGVSSVRALGPYVGQDGPLVGSRLPSLPPEFPNRLQ